MQHSEFTYLEEHRYWARVGQSGMKACQVRNNSSTRVVAAVEEGLTDRSMGTIWVSSDLAEKLYESLMHHSTTRD